MTTGDRLLGGALDGVRERRDGPAPIDRFVAGEGPLLVSVGGSTPAAGLAHRAPGRLPDAGRLRGADAFEVAGWAIDPTDVDADPVPARAVGMAALNALSAPFVPWRRGDPMEALADDVEVIATVGLFAPALRKWDGVDVRVVERTPVAAGATVDAPAGVTVTVFGPDEAAAAFDGADVLFVTGSSLVYGGLGAYLDAARAVPTIVLIGATASFLPGPAFGAGVSILAGARVTDPGAVARGIEAGLCGTDLHDRGLEKVYVAAGAPRRLDLGGAPETGGD